MAHRRYRGILFDLDGTLVDSLELILSSYRHTLSVHLGRVLPDEDWLKTMGMPLRVQLARFSDSPEQIEAMFRTYVAHNQAQHDRLLRFFPGMREGVVTLRKADYRLCVVTSKIREHAIRELAVAGLDGLFDGLVGANEVQHAKPDPEPVLLGLERIGVTAGDALMVGDSVYDLRAARAAGVDAAAALWGPFRREQLEEGQPTYWLRDLSDLLAILKLDVEE
ncbi:MAG: HAD-IA family hydrolase [Gemmatimonadales bacterium]|jgi:pyrophosphatase PpaX